MITDAARAEKKAVAFTAKHMEHEGVPTPRWQRAGVVTDPAEIARIKARVDKVRAAEHRRGRRSVRRLVRVWVTRTGRPEVA